jgi:hypothetical protein
MSRWRKFSEEREQVIVTVFLPILFRSTVFYLVVGVVSVIYYGVLEELELGDRLVFVHLYTKLLYL